MQASTASGFTDSIASISTAAKNVRKYLFLHDSIVMYMYIKGESIRYCWFDMEIKSYRIDMAWRFGIFDIDISL